MARHGSHASAYVSCRFYASVAHRIVLIEVPVSAACVCESAAVEQHSRPMLGASLQTARDLRPWPSEGSLRDMKLS